MAWKEFWSTVPHVDVVSRRRTRIEIIFYFFAVVFFIYIFRLAYLQLFRGDQLLKKSEANFLRQGYCPPLRGRVLDCNGRVLAANRVVYDLMWQGAGKSKLDAKAKEEIDVVSSMLSQPPDLELIKNAERRRRQVVLGMDVPFSELSKLVERTSEFPHVRVANHAVRFYPNKDLASHILGYISRTNECGVAEGKSGLEKAFQDKLMGQAGMFRRVVTAKGEQLEEYVENKAKMGDDLVLEIDLDIQKEEEKFFEVGQSGAVIVMDPENGAIKALTSYPRFDPNRFLLPISGDEWKRDFIECSPFMNRAVAAAYPPASIFKLVTFAAGLELGIIDRETPIECQGFVSVGGRKVYCMRRWGHGKLSAKQMLAYSCNIGCYEIAKRISIDQLAEYSRRFGFGRITGSILGERPGLVPSSSWKLKMYGEQWWRGETLSVSIGQSYLLATPLQVIRAISSIFTGYLVKPRLLKGEEESYEPLAIALETREFLQEAMLEVATRGTARRFGGLTDFKVYAKTGTAQTISKARGLKLERKHREHGLCATHFQYKNEKPLAMVVLFEHTGTSVPAQAATENFLRRYGSLNRN